MRDRVLEQIEQKKMRKKVEKERREIDEWVKWNWLALRTFEHSENIMYTVNIWKNRDWQWGVLKEETRRKNWLEIKQKRGEKANMRDNALFCFFSKTTMNHTSLSLLPIQISFPILIGKYILPSGFHCSSGALTLSLCILCTQIIELTIIDDYTYCKQLWKQLNHYIQYKNKRDEKVWDQNSENLIIHLGRSFVKSRCKFSTPTFMVIIQYS